MLRKSCAVLALGLVLSSGIHSGSSKAQQDQGMRIGDARQIDDDLIVHEWGTFTSVAGRNGVAVEWRPLDGSSDLPTFVHATEGLASEKGLRNGNSCVKCSLAALVRMETPVIYFYTSKQSRVSIRVAFPEGKITEWYPHARYAGDKAIDWGAVMLEPDARFEFPVESADSHYYPARETDSTPLTVCGKTTEHEKFLFYRGVGSFAVPIRARLDHENILISSEQIGRLGDIVLFENQNGRAGYAVKSANERETVFSRPALSQSPQEAASAVSSELRSLLISRGLYEREADAMLATWRDSWFEEGLRIFYVVPREVTDRVIPLAIEPTPSELARVLVGRMEIVTPQMEAAAIDSVQGGRLNEKKFSLLRLKYGRLVGSIVRRAVETTADYQTKSQLRRLLNQ